MRSERDDRGTASWDDAPTTERKNTVTHSHDRTQGSGLLSRWGKGRRRVLMTALPAILAVAGGMLSPVPALAEGRDIACATAGKLDAPAGAVISDAGDLAVEAPPPGTGVTMHADGERGSQSLTVTRSLDGHLLFEGCGLEQEEAGSSAAPDDAAKRPPRSRACSDGAFTLKDYKWDRSFNWYFAAKTTPPEVSHVNAEDALRNGVSAITTANNDCGIADDVSATQSYAGRTNARSDAFRGKKRCRSFGRTDGMSVMDFGNLSGYLAVTCVVTRPDAKGRLAAVEADVRFDKRDHRWTGGDGGPNCTDRYSIRAVATHEAGHVFGLDHVSEKHHGQLTMSRQSEGPCQESEYTLGLGDLNGLRRLYG